MTSRASKLVVAALLLGSVPALAAAHDRDDEGCDHDRDVRPIVVVPPDRGPAPGWTPPQAWPPPAYAPPAPGYGEDWRDHRWRGEDWRDHRWGGGDWREAGWRYREVESVRAQLAALDQQRAEFHAYNAWRPWKLRRYDRWYSERRADLMDRLEELGGTGWR